MSEKKNSGLAITAMILGICSLVIPYADFVCAILAIIFGAIKKNEPMGKAGLIMGIIGIVVSIVLTVILYTVVFKSTPVYYY